MLVKTKVVLSVIILVLIACSVVIGTGCGKGKTISTVATSPPTTAKAVAKLNNGIEKITIHKEGKAHVYVDGDNAFKQLSENILKFEKYIYGGVRSADGWDTIVENGKKNEFCILVEFSKPWALKDTPTSAEQCNRLFIQLDDQPTANNLIIIASLTDKDNIWGGFHVDPTSNVTTTVAALTKLSDTLVK